LQGARRLPPLKAAIVAQLTGKAPRWQAPLAQLGNALAAARPRG